MGMMTMAAEVSVAGDHRDNERHETAIVGGVRRSGSTRIPATVRDISVSGFRIETDERLPMGAVVWLKVDHLAPLMAQVVWSDGRTAGCRFAAPLHPSVLESLLAGQG